MHKVERNAAPRNLINKNKRWKKLLKEDSTINLGWEKFSKTLAKKHTLEALEDMYLGVCCYCEGKIKATGYPEIEHFKPKSKYPELCYEYSNLHYCCKRCNVAKDDKFHDKMIIPNEGADEYIKYIGEIATSINENESGSLMIDTLKLNEREDLRYERLRYFSGIAKNYSLIVDGIENGLKSESKNIESIVPFIKNFITDIEEKSKHGESYCSMVKHNFKDKAESLKSLLEEMQY